MLRSTNISAIIFSAFILFGCGQATQEEPQGPEVMEASQATETETISFYLNLPEDILSLTHGGRVGMELTPAGIPALPASELGDSLAMTGLLRDENGTPVGTGAELEYFPEGQAPGTTWEVYWTIFIPGRGSIYGYELEAVPEEHYPVFETLMGGEDWFGEAILGKVGAGPRPDGYGVILGGNGEFENVTGKFAEFANLTGLTLDGELHGTMELRFIIDK